MPIFSTNPEVTEMIKLIKYFLIDIIKNRVILGLTLFFLVTSFSLLYMDENQTKAVLSLMNIIIIVVPLISMVFAGNYYFNAYEFKEVLLCLPVARTRIILSEMIAVGISLALSLGLGLGIPAVIFGAGSTILYLILITMILSVACASIAMLVVILSREKSRGLGLVLLAWFYFSLLYDVIIMTLLMNLSDYPMEKFVVFLAALNPIDLCRISMMLKLDISALMGYTGALYKEFFSSFIGTAFTLVTMLLWILIPGVISVRVFRKKDL